MSVKLTIFAIGNELLSGAVIDTNTSLIAKLLRPYGILLQKAVILPDDHQVIVQAFAKEVPESDLIITTGGLGPTSDDLTRDAIAEAAGVRTQEHAAARAKLEELLKRRGRTVNENNLRQVYFPEGATVLTNRTGTADSFCTELRLSTPTTTTIPVISLPGIPRETEILLHEEVLPFLKNRFSGLGQAPASTYLRCFGFSESYIGERIEAAKLSSSIQVGYRPIFPEILLTLTAAETTECKEVPLVEKGELVAKAAIMVAQAIGEDHVFSRGTDETTAKETMANTVAKLLQQKNLKFAAAESCTGGELSSMLVRIAGASEFFLGSAVSYSNAAKSALVGVRPALITKYGAVSKEVAIEMARGALLRLGADIAVSVTGIAGPDGGSEEKPVGTFWVGIATTKSEEAFPHFYPAEREMFRRYAATMALDLVRRTVLGLPTHWARQ